MQINISQRIYSRTNHLTSLNLSFSLWLSAQKSFIVGVIGDYHYYPTEGSIWVSHGSWYCVVPLASWLSSGQVTWRSTCWEAWCTPMRGCRPLSATSTGSCTPHRRQLRCFQAISGRSCALSSFPRWMAPGRRSCRSTAWVKHETAGKTERVWGFAWGLEILVL